MSKYQSVKVSKNRIEVSVYWNVKEKGYKKLVVWKKAHQFTILVYKYTKEFPRNEEYGLTSQLRRAVLSVPTNIVEGQASSSRKDFSNFLNMANRSLVETEYLLEVALELGYLLKDRYDELDKFRYETGILLKGLIRSIKNKL